MATFEEILARKLAELQQPSAEQPVEGFALPTVTAEPTSTFVAPEPVAPPSAGALSFEEILGQKLQAIKQAPQREVLPSAILETPIPLQKFDIPIEFEPAVSERPLTPGEREFETRKALRERPRPTIGPPLPPEEQVPRKEIPISQEEVFAFQRKVTNSFADDPELKKLLQIKDKRDRFFTFLDVGLIIAETILGGGTIAAAKQAQKAALKVLVEKATVKRLGLRIDRAEKLFNGAIDRLAKQEFFKKALKEKLRVGAQAEVRGALEAQKKVIGAAEPLIKERLTKLSKEVAKAVKKNDIQKVNLLKQEVDNLKVDLVATRGARTPEQLAAIEKAPGEVQSAINRANNIEVKIAEARNKVAVVKNVNVKEKPLTSTTSKANVLDAPTDEKSSIMKVTNKLTTSNKELSLNPALRILQTRQVLGRLDKVLGNEWNQIEKFAGKKGKEISTMLQDFALMRNIESGKVQANLDDVLGRVFLSEKSLIKVSNAIDTGNISGLSRSEIKLVNSFKLVTNAIGDEYKMIGGKIKLRAGGEREFEKLKDFFPLMYDDSIINTPQFQQDAIQYFTQNRQDLIGKLKLPQNTTPEELYNLWFSSRWEFKPVFEGGKELAEGVAKNLESARFFKVPGNIKDPREVLKKYVDISTKRLAEIKVFGANNEKIAPLFKAASDEIGEFDAARLKKMIDTNRELFWEDDQVFSRTFEFLRAMETPRLIASSPVNVGGGFFTTMLRGGMLKVAGNAIAATKFVRRLPFIRTFSKANAELMRDAGLGGKGDVSRFLSDRLTGKFARNYASFWSSLSAMKPTEVYVRNFSTATGKQLFLKSLKRIERSGISFFTNTKTGLADLDRLNITPQRGKFLAKELKRLGEDKFQVKYREDVVKASLKFSNITQGDLARGALPSWANTSWGKAIIQFRRVAFVVADEVVSVVKGIRKNRDIESAKRLLRLVSAPAFGLSIISGQKLIGALLKDVGSAIGLREEGQTFEEALEPVARQVETVTEAIEEREFNSEAFWNVFEWTMKVVALNLGIDVAVTAIRNPDRAVEAMMGTQASTIVGAAKTVQKAVQLKPLEAAGEAIKTAVPAVSRLLPERVR